MTRKVYLIETTDGGVIDVVGTVTAVMAHLLTFNPDKVEVIHDGEYLAVNESTMRRMIRLDKGFFLIQGDDWVISTYEV
tara:strand:+ start:3576 stop:3812 length:237 start_codon:yes stop_codon:yes gene_type:complete